MLVAGEFEVALDVAVSPGTCECAFIGKDVIQFAVDDEAHGIAGRIFGIRFDVYGPFGRIERGHFHWDHIRAAIDDAVDVLAIPIHDDADLIPMRRRGTPVSGPGSHEWMTLLREDGCV